MRDNDFTAIASWLRVGLCTLSALLSTNDCQAIEEVGKSVPQKPNVILIVSDDQRFDTIGALGNEAIKTPNLDALAKRGCVLTRAVSPNPICTPSRAEILTGTSGFRNGVLDFSGKIDPRLTTLPQAMLGAGYQTCFVGKWHNDGRPSTHGYQQTIGLYSGGGGKWARNDKDHHGRLVTGYRGWVFQTDAGEKFPEKGVGLTANISNRFADAAMEFIEKEHNGPFFLHVNFTAPHDPLLMPPGFEELYNPAQIPLPPNFLAEHPFDHGNAGGRDELLLPFPRTEQDVKADLAVYYAIISHLDQQIGRIIKSLERSGKSNSTIVIFTSDHGLAMGGHGLRGKQNMYEHTVGVPMIFAGPGVPVGESRAADVYLRDMFPTICDLCGIEIPNSVTAKSFAACLKDPTAIIHREVFCYFRDVQRMVRTDKWKLIHYPAIERYQLFDLENDPFEKHDLSEERSQRDILQSLQKKLVAHQESYSDPLLQDSQPNR